jgi:alpha-ketoglutarate-dependent taurine dioxygenase
MHLEHGVFAVLAGKNSFYSTAYVRGTFRFDPGCMVPCDQRSHQTVKYFEHALGESVEHAWDSPGKILVIDNRRTLHARASAEAEPDREMQRLALHLPKVAK